MDIVSLNSKEHVWVHNACEHGSYENFFASGKSYFGKGGRARSQVSARQIERRTGDSHIATHWTPSASNRGAFIDEAQRIREGDGIESPNNYNQINSPGAKY
jgi:hypothetical protein